VTTYKIISIYNNYNMDVIFANKKKGTKRTKGTKGTRTTNNNIRPTTTRRSKHVKGTKIKIKYVPLRLTKKDKIKQKKMLNKSRKLYKKGIYYTRKPVKSYQSKKSKHVINAMKMYNMDHITPNDKLAKATGCSKPTLEKIVNKGQGAYYSSGSRPNQTSQSWGIARMASAITAGKAAVIDYSILKKGCKKNSKALRLAKKAFSKYGKN
jgi:hypothetical protein